jgi:hypothetical protein
VDDEATNRGRAGDKIPRGALAVVAVGLIATVAAALLANEDLRGPAAGLEWVQKKSIPDSAAVSVPGGNGQKMQLVEGHLRATGVNVSGYSLFSSGTILRIDAGAPIGSSRVLCEQRASGGAEVGQTSGSRAAYPRSSEEGRLAEQELPESGVQVEFSSHGTYAAEVLLEDLPGQAANEKGINLEWPAYHPGGPQRWKYYLPSGAPRSDLKLPFVTVWRTTKIPAVNLSCTVVTSAGTATVHTAAAFAHISEPIAE